MEYLKAYSLILLGLLGVVSCEIDINVPEINNDPGPHRNDAYIIKAAPPYNTFEQREIIDNYIASGFETYTPLNQAGLIRYTYDHTTAIAMNSSAFAFPYGLNNAQGTNLWQDSEGYLNGLSGADYDPTNGRMIEIGTEKDSVNIPDKPLGIELDITQLWESYPERDSEKLISYRPVFLDSVIYYRIFIDKPQYINDIEIVFITYKRHYRTSGVGDTYDHNHDSLSSPPWLMKWDRRTGNVDSMYALPFLSSDGVNNFQYQSGWSLVGEDSLYLLSDQGRVEFKTGKYEYGRIYLYQSGKVFTYNSGKRYYNHDRGIHLNLNNYFKDIFYTYPTDKKALVMKGDTLLYVLNVLNDEVSDSIHVDDIPKPDYSRERRLNSYYIQYPLIDEQGVIQLFYIDAYQYGDDS